MKYIACAIVFCFFTFSLSTEITNDPNDIELTKEETEIKNNIQKGYEFLEENKLKENVITLPSGLQYIVIKEGYGIYNPTNSSPCACQYKGIL
jgi:FKBP-type peptidyl-prolyl cis-trans isomerase FklB